MEHARLISIAKLQFTVGKVSSINVVFCGLFEGVQYNSEAGAKCAVYSRAQTKQGRGVIKEIRYMPSPFYPSSVVLSSFMGAWSVICKY